MREPERLERRGDHKRTPKREKDKEKTII